MEIDFRDYLRINATPHFYCILDIYRLVGHRMFYFEPILSVPLYRGTVLFYELY